MSGIAIVIGGADFSGRGMGKVIKNNSRVEDDVRIENRSGNGDSSEIVWEGGELRVPLVAVSVPRGIDLEGEWFVERVNKDRVKDNNVRIDDQGGHARLVWLVISNPEHLYGRKHYRVGFRSENRSWVFADRYFWIDYSVANNNDLEKLEIKPYSREEAESYNITDMELAFDAVGDKLKVWAWFTPEDTNRRNDILWQVLGNDKIWKLTPNAEERSCEIELLSVPDGPDGDMISVGNFGGPDVISSEGIFYSGPRVSE